MSADTANRQQPNMQVAQLIQVDTPKKSFDFVHEIYNQTPKTSVGSESAS